MQATQQQTKTAELETERRRLMLEIDGIGKLRTKVGREARKIRRAEYRARVAQIDAELAR